MSFVQPSRAPGSDFSGLAYQPTAGNPIGVPKGLISPPGANAGLPESGAAGEILRDTPGKRSNATIQYSYVVPAASDASKQETQSLHTAGTLAYAMPYGASGLYGMEMGGSARSFLGASSNGPDRLHRLVSHHHLVSMQRPSSETLDMNDDSAQTYTDTFTSNPRQRITHLINLGTKMKGVQLGVQDGLLTTLTKLVGGGNVRGIPLADESMGFELRDDGIRASPFLLPYDFVTTRTEPDSQYNVKHNGPPLGELVGPFAKRRYVADSGVTDVDDVRYQLYDALCFNQQGLFSETALGPWRPLGFVLYKYSTFGYDEQAEEALDSRQSALFNIAIGGQTIVTQLSTLLRDLAPLAGGSLQMRASASRDRWNRLRTMPGDLLYLVVVGEVVKGGKKVNGAIGELDASGTRLVNIRLELTTSEEMSSDATPIGGYGAGTKQTFDGRHYRMGRMGLKATEVIVGGWQLGSIIDNAASRAMGGGGPIEDPTTYGLNVLVSIKWVNGLVLHEKYWSRRT